MSCYVSSWLLLHDLGASTPGSRLTRHLCWIVVAGGHQFSSGHGLNYCSGGTSASRGTHTESRPRGSLTAQDLYLGEVLLFLASPCSGTTRLSKQAKLYQQDSQDITRWQTACHALQLVLPHGEFWRPYHMHIPDPSVET